MSKLVVLVGGGGHGRVLLDALRASGRTVLAIIDPRRPEWLAGTGLEWHSTDTALADYASRDCEVINGVGSVGDTNTRTALFKRLKAQGLSVGTVVHPRAVVATGVSLGEGAQVFAGAVIQVGTTLGANVIVNTGAIIDHDCRIGANVHIAPGATLCGAVTIHDGAHIGAGAVVLQGISIGCNSIVGAGAVVIAPVGDRQTVIGVPARPLTQST